MAGINNLKEIYEKKGESFLSGLLNQYVIINEKVDGAFFGLKKTQDDKFKYFKKSGEITYVDQVLMKYYNSAIQHFQNLSDDKRQRIPANFFFGFEYFTKSDIRSSRKADMPKNNLVLSYIHRLDEAGKIVETLQSKEQLTRWAEYLDVDAPPIIFEGKLDDEQKSKILEFVYTEQKDLEEKFKTTSFTKYIISVLCPDEKSEFSDRELETIVFRFYGEDSENEAFLAKLVDPIFQQRAQEVQPKTSNSQDYIWLIVIDLMNHFEMYDIDKLRQMISDSEAYEQKYIDLINQIFKDFLKDYSQKYEGLELEIPEYLKRPEFELDVNLVGDPEVVNLIKKNSTNLEIYKVLLNFFRKVRKKSSVGFFTPEMISQLNLIVQKIKNIIMGDAVYEGLFPSFNEFIGAPSDYMTLSEVEHAKKAGETPELQNVNILIGGFQPVTMGHIKAAKALKEKNGNKIVLIAIKGETPTKKSPFSLETTKRLLNKVQQEYPELIVSTMLVPNGQITDIIKELRPQYEPILWGTTDRRVKDYALQFDYIKKRDIPLRISKDFKLVELPSFVKSEDMISLIKDSNYEKFKSETPSSVSAEFFNLQKEIGKNTDVHEANQDARFIEPGLTGDSLEEIV
jgi:phosphopantetheine adenylyltransferase